MAYSVMYTAFSIPLQGHSKMPLNYGVWGKSVIVNFKGVNLFQTYLTIIKVFYKMLQLKDVCYST